MENRHDCTVPDPIGSFTPTMGVKDELNVLREARKSLGGEALRPIEIDMDILADAYPREASFLASSIENIPQNIRDLQSPKTPRAKINVPDSPGPTSGRKIPNRRFFKSEHEREYARNLMKELVQIYILQGVHGKDAFRQALNETRRRIHVRRGETAPSPPPVLSPVQESPYPKLSPPARIETPYAQKESSPKEVPAPSSLPDPARCMMPPSTPSRVKSMVAALQVTSTPVDARKGSPVKKTPGSTRVKAVAESIEAQILSSTPGKKLASSISSAPEPQEVAAPRTSSRGKKAETPPSKRKNAAIVEENSPARKGRNRSDRTPDVVHDSPPTEVKRTRRAAAIAALEEIQSEPSLRKSKVNEDKESSSESSPTKKTAVVVGKKEVSPTSRQRKAARNNLVAIPENQPIVVPARPSRKAKTAGGLIKK